MPKTEPDFVKMAQRIAAPPAAKDADSDYRAFVGQIVEQLRLAWNARGAADIVELETELSGMMGVTASGPYVKNLDRALRALDR